MSFHISEERTDYVISDIKKKLFYFFEGRGTELNLSQQSALETK